MISHAKAAQLTAIALARRHLAGVIGTGVRAGGAGQGSEPGSWSSAMSVDSYLELFTSLFGWTFYGILWDVLVSTGIVYLPFLGILIDNWREPAQGGEVGHASGLSLRRMEIELFIALLVVVLAGQPAA